MSGIHTMPTNSEYVYGTACTVTLKWLPIVFEWFIQSQDVASTMVFMTTIRVQISRVFSHFYEYGNKMPAWLWIKYPGLNCSNYTAWRSSWTIYAWRLIYIRQLGYSANAKKGQKTRIKHLASHWVLLFNSRKLIFFPPLTDFRNTSYKLPFSKFEKLKA